MRFEPAGLEGVWIIEPELVTDERGTFARTFCVEEFASHGLDTAVAQSSLAFNARRGTLRGMHYQDSSAPEAKLVRCTRGALYDVVVDARPESPTYLCHFGLELDAASRRALYIPPQFAHGYLTLDDATEVVYQMSTPHSPAAARGMRFDDPALGIAWPREVAVISPRDESWPDLEVAS